MKAKLLTISAALFALSMNLGAADKADYVAHEWGTFTSVQGADGVQIDWNPLLRTELPKFVYDRSRLRGAAAVLLSKTGLIARQRLETPVIYFYSKNELTVDVTVKFPEGSVTEWYPQQNPPAKPIVRAGEPAARWQGLRVLAAKASEPAYPREAAGSHYYAARATDANPVQIAASGTPTETEKFIFYRGVGSFSAPLTVKSEGIDASTLHLTNTGAEPLEQIFVYEVRDAAARIGMIREIAPGSEETFSFSGKCEPAPLTEARAELAAQMEKALVAAGLYEREAAAMVKTWDDSWFAEPGLRVLYVLSRAWADRVLPLSIDPPPREVARVMVGRAEILTPAIEKALTREVERYRTGDDSTRELAVNATRALGLGRFAEPAVRRICLADPKNRDFSTAAWELLWKAFAPPAPAQPAVVVR
jgi:hypothetical protein